MGVNQQSRKIFRVYGLRLSLRARWTVPILFAASTASAQSAPQTSSTPPNCSFEVASIHRSESDTPTRFRIDGNAGTFHAFSYPAHMLIAAAYGFRNGPQVVSYPGWADTEKYEIIAKVSDEDAANHCLENPETLRAALRQLLSQRFALKAHSEQRQIALYSLTVIPGRLKLKPAPRTAEQQAHYPDDFILLSPPFTITAEHASMRRLCEALSNILERSVTDRTGLADRYTFKLKYSLDNDGPPPTDDRPPLPAALNEQLGLKLIPEKSLMPVVVVDHIEHPSQN